MLKKSLVTAACLLPLLGGCVASQFLGKQIDKAESLRWTADPSLADTLIAVGKPVQTAPGFERALLLAGEKRAYLVQSESDSSDLRRIFAETDLAHLSVLPRHTPGHAGQDNRFSVLSRDGSSTLTVDFEFDKPKRQLQKGEQAKMEKLGFHCTAYAENLSCSNWETLRLQTVNLADRSQLQHTFRTPLPLDFYRYEARRGSIARGTLKALIPLTVAFDIITFPIQAGAVDVKK